MATFEAIDENLRATLAVFGRAHERGGTCELPGVQVTSSGLQFAMFNSAVPTGPIESAAALEALIRRSNAFFVERRVPWSLWVCQGWLASDLRRKLAPLCEHHGLRLVVEMPGMAIDRLAEPARILPQTEVRRVSDAPTRMDFAHLMSVAFGIPMPISRAVYEAEATWNSDFTGYVAYIDGAPVSSAAAITTGEVTGIYAIATMHSHRRHGYAEAVMRRAIEEQQARTGVVPSVLESSDAGLNLYRRLGYHTVTRYAVFAT